MNDSPSASLAARLFGCALAILGLYCGLALAAVAFASSGPALFTAVGERLVDAFSWAAVFAPLWLFAAAFIAFLPGFRPGLVFALAASLAPFVLVAAYARLAADPSAAFAAFPLLEALGLPALGLATGLLTLFCALAIARVALLFDASRADEAEKLTSAFAVEGERRSPTLLLAPAARAFAASPPVTPSPSGAAEREAQPEGFAFRVPDIPPPPRLRCLEPHCEVAAVPPATETDGDGLVAPVPPQDPAEVPERGVVAENAPAQVTADADEASTDVRAADASARPVPLFFSRTRGAAAETGAAAPAESARLIELGGGRPVEVVSVPPAPPAHDESEKEAAIARIFARRKDRPYAVPVDELLTVYPDGQYWIVDEKTKRSAEVLRDTLAEFGIEAEVTGIRKGPVITMFEILPAPGVKLSKITNLADNIALRLAASSVRIVAPIPGKHAVGIEVPNERRSIVSLREIVENEAFRTAKMEVPVILGKDIAGEAQFIDLVQTPHLLIAGATGSGKSVCVNSLILSILFRRSPEEVRLVLIDPKIVELKLYNDIPHLLTPVITEPKRAFQALQYCICEMERRYAMLDRVGVRDIKSYNRKVREKGLAQERLPYIVVVIDEFADLMATTGKELESTLARLAAMSRAVGIHLVLATQRPSIDVITGLIKANIPSRIAFMVASKFDSRIIIDMVGAEKLLGKGDMLFASAWDPFPIRMQGAFVSEEEVERSVEFVKTLGEPDYIDEEIFIDEEEDEAPSLFDDGDGDPLFEQALEIVLSQGKASASFIQRKLKIGYNRAARLVELMEEKGIVGPAQGSKPRDLVRNPEISGRVPSPPAGRGERQPSLIAGLETAPGAGVSTKGAAASGGGLAED